MFKTALRTTALLGSLVWGVVALAVPSSAAAQSAQNGRVIHLWFPSTERGGHACATREINISRGWYRWEVGYNFKDSSVLKSWDRDIFLASSLYPDNNGLYIWTDCTAVSWFSGGYRHWSALTARSGVARTLRTYEIPYYHYRGYRETWFGSWLTKIG